MTLATLSLDQVLEDRDLLQAFQLHCAKHCCDESLYFLVKLKDYLDYNKEFRVAELIEDFLLPDSTFEVDLPPALRNAAADCHVKWRLLGKEERRVTFIKAYDYIYKQVSEGPFNSYIQELQCSKLYQ
jgi:hypothetical protein